MGSLLILLTGLVSGYWTYHYLPWVWWWKLIMALVALIIVVNVAEELGRYCPETSAWGSGLVSRWLNEATSGWRRPNMLSELFLLIGLACLVLSWFIVWGWQLAVLAALLVIAIPVVSVFSQEYD